MKPKEYEHSKGVESLCALLILENPEVEDVIRPSSREDMYLHYDLIVKMKSGKEIKIDVKGLKSLGHGAAKTRDFQWIELRNVNGAPGWLFGHADIFAFQVGEEEFMYVPSKDLKVFTKDILDKMEDRRLYRTDPYDSSANYIGTRIFTRDNPNLPNYARRYDQLILIETNMIKHLATNPFKD